jgi:hypothetical protein
VLKKSYLGFAALVGAVALVGILAACGAEDKHPRHSGDNSAEQDKREQDSKKALGFARRTSTAEAFLDVIHRFEGTAGADQARVELARIRSVQAREALGAGDRVKARALAQEAIRMGDPSIAEQAQATLDQIEHSNAREAGKAVKELTQAGANAEACGKAVQIVSDTLGEQPSPLLLRDVRTATLQQVSGCVQSLIDAAERLEAFAAARKIVETPAAKRALGEETAHALLSTLSDKIVGAISVALRTDLAKGKWENAFATVKAWGDAGAAGPQQLELARQQARDGITKDLLARGQAALGGAGADAVLREVARALKLFEGLNVAPELKSMQGYLEASIECKRLACTPLPAPRRVFTFGATGLLPLVGGQEATGESMPNATQLWVVAAGKGRSMVAREQPAAFKNWIERLSSAKGWVDSSVLENEDTSSWLPVGKALVNVRVWLPTGRDDKLYLLGNVESVQGKDVTVKKISDGQNVTLKREDLRSGYLPKGLKVLAFCGDQLQQTPATFIELVTMSSGSVVAHVMCLNPDGKDDKARESVLGSIRSKPEWLPARRP